MSIEAILWAMVQDVPATAKLILIVLADASNHDGESWLKNATITERTGGAHGVHRSTVIRQIRDQLISRGLVSKTARFKAERGGRQTSNIYTLHLDRGTPPMWWKGSRDATGEGSDTRPPPVAQDDPLILLDQRSSQIKDPKTSRGDAEQPHPDPMSPAGAARWHVAFHLIPGNDPGPDGQKCADLMRWLESSKSTRDVWELARNVAIDMAAVIVHDGRSPKNKWTYLKANGQTTRYSDLWVTFRSWYRNEVNRRGLVATPARDVIAEAEKRYG
jgi:hypothetical protein